MHTKPGYIVCIVQQTDKLDLTLVNHRNRYNQLINNAHCRLRTEASAVCQSP